MAAHGLKYVWPFLFAGLLGCTNDAKRTVDRSGSPELAAFYEQATRSDDKSLRKRALYLIENMAGKYAMLDGGKGAVFGAYLDSLERSNAKSLTRDFSHTTMSGGNEVTETWFQVYDTTRIKADSLWLDLQLASRIWDNSPWRDMYSEAVFREYVMPYRISTEPLDYDWRRSAYNDHKHFLSETDPLVLCRNIEKQLPFGIYSIFRDSGRQSYEFYTKTKRGTCDDQCLYTAMVMRSVGLPVAFDIIPRWGNHNLGHSLNALLLPDGTSVGFNTCNDLQNGLKLANKVPKIYRRTYGLQKTTLYEFRESEFIPPVFDKFDLYDVTAEYGVPTTDVDIPIRSDKAESRLAYLAVPNRWNWGIVAWGVRKGNTYRFADVGTDFHAGQRGEEKGESLGKGIVYLPVVADQFGQYPVNALFVLASGCEPRYLNPDTTRKRRVVLSRKYPRLERIVKFAESLELCVVEGANRPDFSDAKTLYTVTSTPSSYLQKVPVDDASCYRYVRLRKRSGGFSIGELVFYDEGGTRLSGATIAAPAIASETTLIHIFDGNPLTFFTCTGGFNDLWIGLKFPVSRRIGSIGICPRTDDNDISPGDTYELFYWDNRWISLGRQTADSESLTYDHVPDNALLYLRNLTKGIEERPFTYENNIQIWW